MASVVREALVDWVEQRERAALYERAYAAIGSSHSGLGDLAEKQDRYLAAGDLVSVSEIAARTQHPVSTVQSWRRRHDTFPRPLTTLAAGPVWNWDEVERWLRRRAAGKSAPRRVPWPSVLPGAELVAKGLADLASGRMSIEAALVSTATVRLDELGVDIPARRLDDAPARLYELVEAQVGEEAAHSRYNALRRRLSSFLRSLALTHAPAG